MAHLQKYPVERRAFQIDDVDIPNRLCHVRDQTGGRIMVSFRYSDGAMQIPKPGEVWVCERHTSHEWHLFKRRDLNAEHADLLEMEPGDTRIGSGSGTGTVRIRATAIELNGGPITGGGTTVVETMVTSGATTTWTLSNEPTADTLVLFDNGMVTDPTKVSLLVDALTFDSIADGHTLVAYYQTA